MTVVYVYGVLFGHQADSFSSLFRFAVCVIAHPLALYKHTHQMTPNASTHRPLLPHSAPFNDSGEVHRHTSLARSTTKQQPSLFPLDRPLSHTMRRPFPPLFAPPFFSLPPQSFLSSEQQQPPSFSYAKRVSVASGRRMNSRPASSAGNASPIREESIFAPTRN